MGSCLCCSSFNWGETNPTYILQAFVVAGGLSHSYSRYSYLSSVLTFLPGSAAWTPLVSLPRALTAPRASVVGGKIRVVGGYRGGSYRSEVMAKNSINLENYTGIWGLDGNVLRSEMIIKSIVIDDQVLFSCQVLDYHPEPANGWRKAGDLQQGRQHPALVSIGPQELPCLAGGRVENADPLGNI